MTDFERLLALHGPRVHRAAAGLLRDDEEAREVAQDTLARAWAARDRYDDRRPFYPWLYTILRNACRDAAARGRHRARPGLDAERLQGGGRSPFAELSTAQTRAQIRLGLQQISEDHRRILVMRHFEDLSYAEIGELLDLPQGTVMSRLYRARKALVAALGASSNRDSGGHR